MWPQLWQHKTPAVERRNEVTNYWFGAAADSKCYMQSENTSGEILQAQYVKYFVSAQVSKDISGIVNTKKLSENKESKCKRELKFMRIIFKFCPFVITTVLPISLQEFKFRSTVQACHFYMPSDARKQHISLFWLVLLPVLTLPAFQILFSPLLLYLIALSYLPPFTIFLHVLTYHSFTHSCGGCNRPIVIGMAPLNSAPIQLRLVHSNLTSK